MTIGSVDFGQIGTESSVLACPPLLTIDDVLETLDLTRFHEQQSIREAMPADPLEAELLSHLSSDPFNIDEFGPLLCYVFDPSE